MTDQINEQLFDLNYESKLLSAAILDREVFAVDIAPADFWHETNRELWAEGQNLLRQGEWFDDLVITDRLAARGVEVSHAYIAELAACDGIPGMAQVYADSIRDLAKRRRDVEVGTQIVKAAYHSNGTLDADMTQLVGEILRQHQPAPASRPKRRGASWADMAELIGPIAWEWQDWLPSGLLVELVADSGVGKSVLALRIAACYLNGWMWPDGTPFTGRTGKVLWVETEAGQALNLERAKAWGLPIENIVSPFENPLDDASLFDASHLDAIAAEAMQDDVRLIVVDSLSGGTAGREKGEDQMPVVKWLAELARNLGKPNILLHHLRKRGLSDGGDVVTLDRVRGSTVIVQPARVVWALDIPNPNTLDHKRLSVIKSNLGRFPKSIGLWVGDDGLTFGEAPIVPKTMTKRDQARLLLLRLLAGGPRLQTDVEAEAESEGISVDTLRDAKKKLGVNATKDGHSGKWSWALPDPSSWQDRDGEADE